MLINIGEILSGRRKSVVVDCSIGLDDINLNKQNLKFVSPPVVKGKILNVNEELIFTGELYSKVEVPCDICSEMVEIPVETDFEVHLVNNPESFIMEYDTYIYTADSVDITDLIAIEVLEEIPMRVVCREYCKGLCPTCGINLNIGSCNCIEDEKVIDIRLQKLNDLIK
ncbi:MAG: YceD family protein [Filifactoraceae bacterium]